MKNNLTVVTRVTTTLKSASRRVFERLATPANAASFGSERYMCRTCRWFSVQIMKLSGRSGKLVGNCQLNWVAELMLGCNLILTTAMEAIQLSDEPLHKEVQITNLQQFHLGKLRKWRKLCYSLVEKCIQTNLTNVQPRVSQNTTS